MQKKIKLVMMACMVTSMHSVESLNANEGQTQETPKGPDVHYQSVDWRTLVGTNDFSIEEFIDFVQRIPTGKDGSFKSEIDKIWDEIKKIQQKDPLPAHWTQHPMLKKKIESIPVGLKTSFEGRMYVVSVNGFDVYVPVIMANKKVGMVRALIPMRRHTVGVNNNVEVYDNTYNKVIQAINIEHPWPDIHGLSRTPGVHLDNVQGYIDLEGPVGGHVFLTNSNKLNLSVSRKYLLSTLKYADAFHVTIRSLNANEGQTQETPKRPDVRYQSVDWRTLVGANDFSIEELIDFGQKIPTGKDGRFKSELDKIWDEIKKIQQKDPHPTHWTQNPMLKKKIESIPAGLKTSFEGRLYVVSVNGFDVYVPVIMARRKEGMVRALIPMMSHTIGIKNNTYVQDDSHNKVIQAINIEHPRATIHGLPRDRDIGVSLDNVQGDLYLDGDGQVGGIVYLTNSNKLNLVVSRKNLLSRHGFGVFIK